MGLQRLFSAAHRLRNATRAMALGWLVCTALLAPLSALAEDIRVRSAFVEPSAGVLLLTSQVEFDLPDGAQQSIRDGVDLTLTFEVEITRSRHFLFDENVAKLEQRYELQYHAVSSRYLVRNLNSGAQGSYPSLEAALDSLRRIERIPILDEALLSGEGRYEISLRASLDVHTMPDALRFVLFWADDWRQSSDWYTWRLRL